MAPVRDARSLDESVASSSAPEQATGAGERWYRHQLLVDEPAGDGVRRVCLGELDRALGGLGEADRATGVHTARKAIKRTRAALRLVRDRIGREDFERENTALGDAGRALTELRTAHVMAATAAEVGAGNGDVAGRLEARAGRLEREIVDARGALDAVAADLIAARARLAGLALGAKGDGGPGLEETFAAALLRSHARGARAMEKAARSRSTDAFHLWRRRVRYLRYQVEILHAVWPHPIGELADELTELADLLGVEHDLADLAVLIESDPGLVPDEAARVGFLAAVAEGRAIRQAHALELGSRVYSDATRQLLDHPAAVEEAPQGSGQG